MSGAAIPQTPSDEAYAVDADQGEVFTRDDPLAMFESWFALAREREPNDPNAMALATADGDGLPDVRMVLLKDYDVRGLAFYTSLDSAKGQQLSANPQAALLFHWKSIRRQVRFRGPVSRVDDAEADAYFATRARGARIGAWASKQSRPMEGRFALEKAVAAETLRFGIGDIARPDYWVGFRLEPRVVEFWVNRPFRLHDRLAFTRSGGGWTMTRLFP